MTQKLCVMCGNSYSTEDHHICLNSTCETTPFETNKYAIKIGDIVEVKILSVFSLLRGTVLYIPFSPGEGWVIETEDGKYVYYIQAYEYIFKQVIS